MDSYEIVSRSHVPPEGRTTKLQPYSDALSKLTEGNAIKVPFKTYVEANMIRRRYMSIARDMGLKIRVRQEGKFLYVFFR